MADINQTGYDRIYLARANEQELKDNKDKIRSNELVIAKDSHRAFHKGEDGTLNKIVSNYTFDTIADLQSTDYLVEGDIVELSGYYEKGDGAGHKRIISAVDDGSGVLMANGKFANLIHDGTVNPLWFGAKADTKLIGTSYVLGFDNTGIINNCINYGMNIHFTKGLYYTKGNHRLLSTKSYTSELGAIILANPTDILHNIFELPGGVTLDGIAITVLNPLWEGSCIYVNSKFNAPPANESFHEYTQGWNFGYIPSKGTYRNLILQKSTGRSIGAPVDAAEAALIVKGNGILIESEPDVGGGYSAIYNQLIDTITVQGCFKNAIYLLNKDRTKGWNHDCIINNATVMYSKVGLKLEEVSNVDVKNLSIQPNLATNGDFYITENVYIHNSTVHIEDCKLWDIGYIKPDANGAHIATRIMGKCNGSISDHATSLHPIGNGTRYYIETEYSKNAFKVMYNNKQLNVNGDSFTFSRLNSSKILSKYESNFMKDKSKVYNIVIVQTGKELHYLGYFKLDIAELEPQYCIDLSIYENTFAADIDSREELYALSSFNYDNTTDSLRQRLTLLSEQSHLENVPTYYFKRDEGKIHLYIAYNSTNSNYVHKRSLTFKTSGLFFVNYFGGSEDISVDHIECTKTTKSKRAMHPTYIKAIKNKFIGMCFFDTTNNKPIWWNGINWVDATGTTV